MPGIISPFILEAEKKAIRATWDATSEAFLAKDWERYSSMFEQDQSFQMVHPAQRDWISGFADFQARYKQLVTAEGSWDFKTTRFDTNIGPEGDIGWAMVEFTFSQDGGNPTTNWELVVFRKTEGQWRVASAMAAAIPK